MGSEGRAFPVRRFLYSSHTARRHLRTFGARVGWPNGSIQPPVYESIGGRAAEQAPARLRNYWGKRYASPVGAVYLDYYRAMKDARDGLPVELAKDGVHPTEAGYRIMAQRAISEAMR
jgi:lysophospholipase L1-like esterase